MAKYTITHSCGHTEVVDIVGPGKDRESRANWLASKPCRECANAAATQAASAAATQAGLPALTGSEKQIAWAETIRQAAKAELDALLTVMRAKAGDDPRTAQAAQAAAEILAKDSAMYWIDSRNTSARARIAAALGL